VRETSIKNRQFLYNNALFFLFCHARMNILPTRASVIEYIEENYTKFDTLAFCRAFKYDFLRKAVTDFNDAIKEIADRTLRSNNANKELIKWAKALRKSKVNVHQTACLF
jgi:phosphoenolpyruvate carboxylase